MFIAVGLSGCNQVNNALNPEKNKFVGTWINNAGYMNITISLFSDGTCAYMGISGIWDLKDGKLVIDMPNTNPPLTATYNYIFSNNDRTLTLTDINAGSNTVYTKQ